MTSVAASPVAGMARRRILVVEDELMIRMLLEEMLDELGYTTVAAVARLDEAIEAARTSDFDAAILDINLSGEPVYSVADILVKRGLPFIFVTGYDEDGLPEAYRGHPTLRKPFQQDGVAQVLSRVWGDGKP